MEIKVRHFQYVFLHFMLLLVLLKSTGIGYGYPNLENQLGSVSYLPQQLMQILILGMLLLYLFFIPKTFALFLTNSPLLVSLFFIIIIGMLLSPHIKLTLRYIISFLMILLPVVLYFKVYSGAKLFNFLKNFFITILFLSAAYIVVFPYFGIMGGNHAGAFRGVFLHKNMFGLFCVLSSLFCLACFFRESKFKNKCFYLFAYFLSFVLTVGSKSTTSLLLFFLLTASFFFFYLLIKIRNLQKRSFIYYAFITVLLFITVTFSAYYEEIAYALGKDPTLTGRTGLWEILMYISFDRPILGHGLGLFFRPEIMHQYSIEFGWVAKSAHNSFIDLFLGVGFLGSAVFLLYLLLNLIKFPFIANNDPVKALAVAGIVLPLCFGMSESGMLLSTNFPWVCLVSFLLILNEQKK